MKGKSLGWLLLVGALAVPAVLFYKWWTQMKATQGVEAKQAVPASAPFSGGAAPAPASEPPAEPAPAPAPAGDAPAQPPAAQPAPAAEPAPAAPAEPAPSSVAQAAPETPPAPAPAPDGAPSPEAEPSAPEEPASNPGAMVAKIEYMPKTSRDPMLSVADQRELLKERMAAQISQQEIQKAAEEVVPAAPPPPPAKPLCDSFDLQGIIGAGGDVAAIVNDRIVREGDHIAGAVVERLTTRTVVFRKGKKTCMKRVSK